MNRHRHYFCCPECGAKLRAALVAARPKDRSKWEAVDWSLSSEQIARQQGVTKQHVSGQRARYAPQTLRAARGERERAARARREEKN